MVDKKATEEEIKCTLTYNRTLSFIKHKFDERFENAYNKFTSIARDDAVQFLLQQEIEFQYYHKTGVIEDYQFMHKGTNIQEIQESFHTYQYRLFRGFLSFGGLWQKYFQPINMVKNYYGEKIGFEYAYLYHYQSFLIYPTICGILVTLNSIYWLVKTGNLKNSFDTRWNGAYGLAVPVWGAIF